MPEGSAVVRLRNGPARSLERRRKHARSKIQNGTDVLPHIDGRTLIAKREISSALARDQSPDGVEHLPEARLQLVRRFAAAAVIAEQMESRLANGEKIDIAEHALLCSTLVRVARQIGVNRIAKDVTTPSLDQYLRQRQNGNADAEPVDG
jgi:hypothetical protein